MKAKNKSTLLEPHWSEILAPLKPCDYGMEWAREQKSAKEAWLSCDNSEYLIWVVASMAATKAARARVRKFVVKHSYADIWEDSCETFAYNMAANVTWGEETCRAIRRHWKMPTLKRVKAAIKKGKKSK